jgi:hypothetical protein
MDERFAAKRGLARKIQVHHGEHGEHGEIKKIAHGDLRNLCFDEPSDFTRKSIARCLLRELRALRGE